MVLRALRCLELLVLHLIYVALALHWCAPLRTVQMPSTVHAQPRVTKLPSVPFLVEEGEACKVIEESSVQYTADVGLAFAVPDMAVMPL